MGNNEDISLLKKLLRKPPAAVAVAIILLTCIVAIFAYQLAPDNTPYANNMIVELGAKPPGFTKQLLLTPKVSRQTRGTWLAEFFSGTPSDFNTTPINAIEFSADNAIVTHYIDDGMQDTLVIPIAKIIAADKLNMPLEEQYKYVLAHHVQKRTFYLGTDRYGRDILSRLLVGSRVSIAVGLVAVLLSLTIGIILGALSGYYGGFTDNAVMWLINILWAIPTLLLVFAITLTIGKGFWEIFIAIGLTMWVSTARLVRGQVIVIREMEYVAAAKALGLGNVRIIFRHILSNIAGPLMVVAASNFATAILIEAGLSFLGIGVQPPQPSWGLMIKEHYNFLLTDHPILAIIPGIAIMLLVYAFNILGNRLRDVLDVKE